MARSQSTVEQLRDARRRRYDEAFKDRQFEVEQEIHYPLGKAARTIFGHLARHVFVIRDAASGERFVVSGRTLRVIHDEYRGVEIPDNRPRLTG